MTLGGCRFGGLEPGALGTVVALHGRYYCGPTWRFDPGFEVLVAAGLADLLGRFDPDRDLFLNAWLGESLVGSISVDGGDPDGVRIRFFIVDEAARGLGLGAALITRALAFCDARTDRVWLSTFEGLEPARRLYERHGFVVSDTRAQGPYQAGVGELVFARTLPDGARNA